MANTPVLQRVLAASVQIANKSAELVRQIMTSGDLGVIDKGGQKNLQTRADRSVEKLIRASLFSKFPDLNVIGEEDEGLDESADAKVELDPEVLKMECPAAYKNITEKQIVVWVDPLDGTAEFTEGLLDHVTILIGLAVDGKAVAGVVNQPFYNYQAGSQATLGRSLWGLVGLGAFNWTRVEPPVGRRILITTRSHSNKLVNSCLESMAPTAVERQGGAGNKVIRVIEGEADAYVFASPGCKKWDTCAPEAILCALDGELTDVHGCKIQYHKDVKFPNTGGVIATFRGHDDIIKMVPQEVRDALKA